MLDVEHEIQMFKQDLMMSGLEDDYISVLVVDLRRELREGIESIVDYGRQQAEEIGAQFDSEQFLKELNVSKFGDMYVIDTISGRTDFSVPPFQMLPHLLKNGKIAKDGSIYKVIPVKQNNEPRNTQNVMKSMNNARTVARDKRRAERNGNVNFRVASSKQDPNSKWVHPGFKRDFTDMLRQINDDMNYQVESFIRDTIDKYKRF